MSDVICVPPALWERFWAKVEKTPTCWLWTAATTSGYGVINVGGVGIRRAHRIAYTLLVGPIPEGLHLDHLCHNADLTCPGGSACTHRRCVNPEHLEPTSHVENIRRGRGGDQWAAKTHCPFGHAYDATNTYITVTGSRACRECHRRRCRERAARHKEGLTNG